MLVTGGSVFGRWVGQFTTGGNKGGEPGIVQVTLVHDQDGAFGEGEGPGLVDLVFSAFGEGEEGRKVAVVVQEEVDFDPGPGPAEGGPGKEVEAEGDEGSVQGVEFVFELEAVSWGEGQKPLLGQGEKGLEERGGPFFAGLGEGGPGHRLGTQVVELFEPGLHGGHAIPQGMPAGQLEDQEVNELVPSGEGPGLPSGAVVFLQGLESMSGYDHDQLLEDRATMRHRLISPFWMVPYLTTPLYQIRRFIRPSFYPLTGRN